MRKSLTIWGAFLIGGALLMAILFFAGRQPEARLPGSAIPRPEESAPYVYYEGEGAGFSSYFMNNVVDERGIAGRFTGRLVPFFRLLEQCGDTALLVTWQNNRVTLTAAATCPRTMLRAIGKGTIPEEWATIPGLSVQTSEGEGLVLDGPAPLFPVRVTADGGMVLMASSQEELASMKTMLASAPGRIVTAWSLEKGWDNHVRIFDGGLFAQLAAIEKIPVTMGNLGIDVAWTETGRTGHLKWTTEGLAELLPGGALDTLRPVSWNDRFFVTDPLIAAFGVNLPGYAVRRITPSDMEDLTDVVGVGQSAMQDFLPGPVMASLGGKSKFLLFSLPGLLVQFPDRGAIGKAVVEAFWKNDWSSFVPKIDPLDGFTAGGTTTIPFSILGAASEDMVALGLMDRDVLRQDRRGTLSAYLPALKADDSALLWFYLDGLRLGQAMESLANAGRSVEKMGQTIGVNVDGFAETGTRLRRMGSLSLVMPTIGSGELRWTLPETAK